MRLGGEVDTSLFEHEEEWNLYEALIVANYMIKHVHLRNWPPPPGFVFAGPVGTGPMRLRRVSS